MSNAQKLPIATAAQKAGLHVNTLRKAINRGELHSAEKVIVKGNGQWYVSLEDVISLAQKIRGGGVNTEDNTQVNTAGNTQNNTGHDLEVYRETIAPILAGQQQRIEELAREAGRVPELENSLKYRDQQIETLRTEKTQLSKLVTWLVIALVLVAVAAAVLVFIAR